MENNKNIRELYSIYLELGHEVFEEQIKKPMELYLHANSNIISMNSLNTIIANAMEKSKLGKAGFDEHDIFSPPNTEEKIYFDDTITPIYDDYNDDYDISVHLLLRRKLIMITICLLYLMIMMMRIIMIAILLNLLPL
jgi:hypothetical protein